MKHRLAMVGFGGMAGWHYDLIQRIDDLEVAGIWDIKEERRTYAEGKGIHVYKSEEDLMADPTTMKNIVTRWLAISWATL